MARTNLVVGGGISGLYAAFLLACRPGVKVLLLEQAPHLGGLLRSYDYGPMGAFDHGVHTFYETGIPGVDDAIRGILPDDDWNNLSGYARDLAGSWLDGTVQFRTPYPSLFDRSDRDELLADLISNLTPEPQPAVTGDAMEAARQRFGAKITERIVRPVIEARQYMPAEAVHALAVDVQGFSRIAMVPQPAAEALNAINGFGARLAFPDQRAYPERYLSTKRSYYPRQIGLSRFVDAFADRLRSMGVEIVTAARLAGATRDAQRVTTAQIFDATGQPREIEIDAVYWSAGYPPLRAFLGLGGPAQDFDPPNPLVIVNVLIDRPAVNGGVYYVNFHAHPRVHRVSFPAEYAGSTRPDGLHPICVELVYPRGASFDDAGTEAEAALRQSGILPPDGRIVWQAVESSRPGYPSFSLKNMNAIKAMRDEVTAEGIANLHFIGLFSREGVFFQTDLLCNIHELLG